MAASVGDTAKLELFLMAGLSINSADYDMRTALHLAAAEDNSDCVKFLLKSKSDVNAVDRFGNTPLYDNLRVRLVLMVVVVVVVACNYRFLFCCV